LKINSICLQNIKSYADREIKFFDGVNFISGINGAGKSTIIESIGFALFDVKPKPLVNFLRDGAKSGAVTVQFTANDDREYRVVRKLRENTAYAWQVYDVEADYELDLHGGYDVRAWLAENLGIDPDQDPEKLFRDVIGVNQGNFTAPFLQTEVPRKQVFNSILKVDGYREAYRKSAETAGILRDAIRDKEKERDILLTRVENYDELKDEVTALEGFLREKQAELAILQEEIRAGESERDRLQNIKTGRDKTEAAVREAGLYINNLTEKMAGLEQELARAQEAARTVETAAHGYNEYLRLKVTAAELEKQRTERDRLQAALAELEKDIGRSEAEIKTDRENIAGQRQRLALEQSGLIARENELAAGETAAREEMARFAAPEAFLDRLLKAKTGMDERLAYLQYVLRRLEERMIETREKTEPEIARLVARLARREEVARQAATVEELEPVWLAKRDEVGQQYHRIRTLEENRRQAAGGNCPFLDGPCQNVGGDLDAYFAAEIEKAQAGLAPMQQALAELESSRELARQAQQELVAMDQEARQLENLQAGVADLMEKIRQTMVGLPDEKTGLVAAEILSVIQEGAFGPEDNAAVPEIAAAVPAVAAVVPETAAALPESQAALAGELRADLHEGLAGIKALTSHINGWDHDAVISGPSAHLAGLARRFREALHKFATAGSTAGEMADRLNRNLTEEKGAAAGRLAVVETERRQAVKRLTEIAEEQRLLKYKEDQLTAREKILADQRVRRDVRAERLEEYKHLDSGLETVRQQQAGHEAAYNDYLRNQAEAAKVEQLSAELSRTGTEIADRTQDVEALRQTLTELAEQFDAARYTAVEDDLTMLIGRRGVCDATLQERQKALAEKKIQLTRMEEWRDKAAAVDRDIYRDRASLELLEFVRSTLNRAGEPIVAVYLQHLSREANVIYREVAKENVTLKWQPDYEIVLVDNHNGRERTRGFAQLSGGEQMTAALAVRLALLKHLSGTNIAFFDEPTTNLDSERRNNLAQTIPEVTAEFDQIFIISHDDTFDSMTDNIIQLRKDSGTGTELVD